MVTLQLGAPALFWVCVPPGHSALSKTPPLLLFTVKVKLTVPQQTPEGVQVPLWQVSDVPSQF